MKTINVLAQFNSYASEFLNSHNPECRKLYESVKYSALSEGKKFRPNLMFASANALGVEVTKVFDLALAIELLHTYTLIHDDLPCLDDDTLRRGKPCNHLVYGEDIALLAGDLLQSLAFKCIAMAIQNGSDSQVLSYFANACIEVVEGQSIDIDEDYKTSVEKLETVHNLKTGSLIQFALIAPLFYTKDYGKLESLLEVGQKLGLVFQIKDDILDYTASDEELGKSGSDFENEKNTYVSFLGIEQSKQLLEDKVSQIILTLQSLEIYTNEFEEICSFSVNRTK